MLGTLALLPLDGGLGRCCCLGSSIAISHTTLCLKRFIVTALDSYSDGNGDSTEQVAFQVAKAFRLLEGSRLHFDAERYSIPNLDSATAAGRSTVQSGGHTEGAVVERLG